MKSRASQNSNLEPKHRKRSYWDFPGIQPLTHWAFVFPSKKWKNSRGEFFHIWQKATIPWDWSHPWRFVESSFSGTCARGSYPGTRPSQQIWIRGGTSGAAIYQTPSEWSAQCLPLNSQLSPLETWVRKPHVLQSPQWSIKSGATQGLITSQSRISKENLTIPRLELVAGHMVANLAVNVRDALQPDCDPLIHYWSDSIFALYWIRGSGEYQQFVANRVKKIQQHQGIVWHHVPTDQNPADLGSRGGSVLSAPLWKNGPPWLPFQDHWPLILKFRPRPSPEPKPR